MFGGHECGKSTLFVGGTSRMLCWRCPEAVAFAIDLGADSFTMIGYSINGYMFVIDNNEA